MTATRAFLHQAAVILLAACAVAMAPDQARTQEQKVPVVVELFTSQSCSSCPPADRLLGELAQRSGIIAMSLHVDYWNHLRWKDTMSSAKHTARQRYYARWLGLPNVFTPQIVINGVATAVGSRVEAVERAIREARNAKGRIPVEMTMPDDDLLIRIGASTAGGAGNAKILFYPLLSARTVDIKRGENRGRTITYHNVARDPILLGTWRGEDRTFRLAHDKVMTGGADRCAVLLQDEHSGAILGAALLADI